MKEIANGVLLTEILLNSDECNLVIALAQKNQYRVARMKALGRNNKETFISIPKISQTLFTNLNNEMTTGPKFGFKIREISQRLECYLYEEGDFVASHWDASVQLRPDVWSSFTLVVYLSDSFQGGETIFPELNLKLKPGIGQGILFNHSLRHEGGLVLKGNKYIIRANTAVI